jgi:hypothetical protein
LENVASLIGRSLSGKPRPSSESTNNRFLISARRQKQKLAISFPMARADLGGERGFILPALAQFDFVHRDPSLLSFRDSTLKAAESGSILAIRQAAIVLTDFFLISLTSSDVNACPLYDTLTNIARRFRVLFLIDRPPMKLLSHLTFIHCGIVSIAKLAAILIRGTPHSAMGTKGLAT